jgi:DNA-binding transcriptional MerR regulator
MARFYVKELAQATGASTDAVRYYVHIGLLAPKRDDSNRYQLFDQSDVKRVHFIRRAKHLGYTLKEIRHILEQSARGHSPCPLVREIIQRRITDNRRQIEESMLLQERMERALARWLTMPDGIPDGETVCQLIESVVEP